LQKKYNIIAAAFLGKKSNQYGKDKNVKYLSLFLLLFVSFLNNVLAQNVDEPQQSQIYVSEGAFIYSGDPDFTQQITDKNITVNKSEVSLTISADKTRLIVKGEQSNKEISDKDHGKVIATEAKTEEKLLAKTKIYLKKRKVISCKFNNVPSDDHLNTDKSINTSFVHETSSYNFLKYFLKFTEKINVSLEFVYSQKYALYKSVYSTYHYSTFYSVRPPPMQVLDC